MNETMELLREEIIDEIENLNSLTPGSEEHSVAVDSLVKLYKMKLEEEKVKNERTECCKRRSVDEKQITQQNLIGYIRLGVDVAGIILPLIFYAGWLNAGFKFEETGAFSSATFKGLINRFRPTK